MGWLSSLANLFNGKIREHLDGRKWQYSSSKGTWKQYRSAQDSSKLDAATGKAADSSLLDGLPATHFAPINNPSLTGNVGIGTSSPKTKLSIGTELHDSPNEPGRVLNWYHDTTGAGGEISNANHSLTIGNNSNNTSRPQHVGISLFNTNTADNTWSPAMTFGGLSQSGMYMNGAAAIATQLLYAGDANFRGGDLHFFTQGDGMQGGLVSRMLISESGRVGIGVPAPSAPLEVLGVDSGITISSASANRPHLSLVNGTTEKLRLSCNGTYAAIGDGTDSNRYMSFRNGNVGVGTTNPTFNLSVAGTLGISEAGATGARLKISTSAAGAIFDQNDNSNIYFRQIGQTKLTIDYPTGDVVATNDMVATAFRGECIGEGSQLSNVKATKISNTSTSTALHKDQVSAVYMAGNAGSSSTVSASVTLMTVYHTGHWGQQPWGFIEVFEDYYTGGYKKYFWQAAYGSSNSYTNLMDNYGYSTQGSVTSTVTQVCSSSGAGTCHSGQSIWKTTYTGHSGGTYRNTRFKINIAMNNWTIRGYNHSAFTTTYDGTEATGTNGSRIYLHTVSDAAVNSF